MKITRMGLQRFLAFDGPFELDLRRRQEPLPQIVGLKVSV